MTRITPEIDALIRFTVAEIDRGLDGLSNALGVPRKKWSGDPATQRFMGWTAETGVYTLTTIAPQPSQRLRRVHREVVYDTEPYYGGRRRR